MKYSISNDLLSVAVQKNGIELCSIFNKRNDKEYMWQGDPEIWANHAPVLFPVVGMQKNGETLIDGRFYAMPKHGLIRGSDKPELIEQTESSLTFRFSWDKDTLKLFPFKFLVDSVFVIKKNVLTVSHQVTNLDEKDLPYNFGEHPAFNCPLFEGEVYEDYHIELEKTENLKTFLINDEGLLTGESLPCLENSKTIALHKNLFDRDALIFKDQRSRKASLVSRNHGAVLTVDFPEFPYLGIWAKPAAPFVCIEPWHGVTEHKDSDQDFYKKEKLRILKPNESRTHSYSITIH